MRKTRIPPSALLAAAMGLGSPPLASASAPVAARLDFAGVRARFRALGETVVVPSPPEGFILALARPYLELSRSPSGRADFEVEEPGEYEIWLPPDPPISGTIGRLVGPGGPPPQGLAGRLFAPRRPAGERAAWACLFRGPLSRGRHAILFENEEARSVVAISVALRDELLAGLAERRAAVFVSFDGGHAEIEALRAGLHRPHLFARVNRRPEDEAISFLDALRRALADSRSYRLAPAARGEVAFRAEPPDRLAPPAGRPEETGPGEPLGEPIVLRHEPPIGIGPSDRLELAWAAEGPEALRLAAAIDLDGDGAADLIACAEEDADRIFRDTFLLRRPFTFDELLRWEIRRRGVAEEIAYVGRSAIIAFPRRSAGEREEVSLRLRISYELADYPYVILSCAVESPERQRISVELDVDADRDGRAERRLRSQIPIGKGAETAPSRVDFVRILREKEPSLLGGQVLGLRVVLERGADPGGAPGEARRFELAEIGIARRDAALPLARAFSAGRAILAKADAPSSRGSARRIPIGELSRAENPDPFRLRPRLLATLIAPDTGGRPSRVRIRALDLVRAGREMIELAGWPAPLPWGGKARASESPHVETGGLVLVDRFALAAAPRKREGGILPPLPILEVERGGAPGAQVRRGAGSNDLGNWRVEGDAAVIVTRGEEGLEIASREVKPRSASVAVRLPVSADLRAYRRLEGAVRYSRRGGPPVRLEIRVSLDSDPAAPAARWIAEEVSLEPFAGEPSAPSPRRLEIPILDLVEERYAFAPAYRIREIVFHAPEGEYDLRISEFALHPAPDGSPPASRFVLADWSARAHVGRIAIAGGDRARVAWLPSASLPVPARGANIFSISRTFEPIDVPEAPLLFLAADLSPGAPAALIARLRAARIRDGSPLEKILPDPANRWIDLREVLGEDVRLAGIDLRLEWLGTPIRGILPELALGGLHLARAGSIPVVEFARKAWELEPERAWEARFLTDDALRSWEWKKAGGEARHRIEGGELRVEARFAENASEEAHVALRTKTPGIDIRRFPFLRIDGEVDDPDARSVDGELFFDRGPGGQGRSVRFPLPPGFPVLDLGPIVEAVFPDLRADEVPILRGIGIALAAGRERAAGDERGGIRALRLRRIEVFGPARVRRSLWEGLAEEPLWRIDERVFRAAEIPGLLEAIADPEARAVQGPAIALARGKHIFEPFAHPLIAGRSLLLVPDAPAPPLPEIAWRRVNATRYVASVRAESPFLLVLNELYHDGWMAYIRGTPRAGREGGSAILSGLRDAAGAEWIPPEDHWVANGCANGFFIRRSGAYEVVVEFFPQRFLEAGIPITGSVLLVLATLAVLRARRRSRSPRIRVESLPAAPAPPPARAEESRVRRPEATR